MTLRLCDTQWPNSGLFLQNALVEYIGVYSDTNEHFIILGTQKITLKKPLSEWVICERHLGRIKKKKMILMNRGTIFQWHGNTNLVQYCAIDLRNETTNTVFQRYIFGRFLRSSYVWQKNKHSYWVVNFSHDSLWFWPLKANIVIHVSSIVKYFSVSFGLK